jgi:hypothetical protein
MSWLRGIALPLSAGGKTVTVSPVLASRGPMQPIPARSHASYAGRRAFFLCVANRFHSYDVAAAPPNSSCFDHYPMTSCGTVAIRLAAAVLLLLGAPRVIWSQEAPRILEVQLGIAGHAKRGHWAEVAAVVRAGSEPLHAQFRVLTRDGDGAPVATVSPTPIVLAAGESTSVAALVKIGPPRSPLTVQVLRENQVVVEHPVDVRAEQLHGSTTEVIATLGPSVGVEGALPFMHRARSDEDFAAVAVAEARYLPTTGRAYDAIDCLVVHATVGGPLAQCSEAQRDALLEWVRFGGRLIVVAGGSGESLLASGGPWGALLPGEVRGSSALKSDAGLRALANEAPPAESMAVENLLLDVHVPRHLVEQWESGVSSEDRPLIVDSPLGMGRLSLVLVDLTRPPLATWTGRSRLMARVLAGDLLGGGRTEGPSAGGRMAHLGYRDLSGQLRSVLDQFPQVTPVHFYTVAGLLLVYLLLLGPGEYFLLKKGAPRAMHLTWLLFPVLVLLFTVGAASLGRSSRGEALLLNQVELVDLNTLDGRQRGTVWAGMFSPTAQTFQLSAAPAVALPGGAVERSEFAWQGLPGSGLGGVDQAPMASVFQDPYVVRPGNSATAAKIDRLPLAVATSKQLAGSWWGTFAPGSDLSALRKGRVRSLEGSFRNIAPVPLQNAYLAHAEGLYRARNEIAPGALITIDQLAHKHLEYQLTQRRVLETEEMATPWDQEETDVPRILNIMMFHAAVRGRNYTVLSHRYQPELDFTHLIKNGYAVLVGRAETPAVDLQHEGEPFPAAQVRRWTYYRIIYPVAMEVAQPNAAENTDSNDQG